MPRRSTLTISTHTVEGFSAEDRDVIFWDRDLPGFGVRVYPSGRKVYVVQSRARGAPRRITLGIHGALTTEQARKRAAGVIDRIKRGEDPTARPSVAETTVAALAARYMSAHVAANCNAHTASIYRGALDNHILPALGAMPLGAVERSHVAALHYRLRDTPRAANRALMILAKMFALAAAWGLGPEGNNPCRSVRKYKERKRERFLTREEYRRLGTAEQWIKEGKNAIKWTRLSCRKFRHNAVRLQLHALAYNLGNFMRTLALPDAVEQWSLTTLREKLVKIGAKIVRHGRYIVFQMAEVAIPRHLLRRHPPPDRSAQNDTPPNMTTGSSLMREDDRTSVSETRPDRQCRMPPCPIDPQFRGVGHDHGGRTHRTCPLSDFEPRSTWLKGATWEIPVEIRVEQAISTIAPEFPNVGDGGRLLHAKRLQTPITHSYKSLNRSFYSFRPRTDNVKVESERRFRSMPACGSAWDCTASNSSWVAVRGYVSRCTDDHQCLRNGVPNRRRCDPMVIWAGVADSALFIPRSVLHVGRASAKGRGDVTLATIDVVQSANLVGRELLAIRPGRCWWKTPIPRLTLFSRTARSTSSGASVWK